VAVGREKPIQTPSRLVEMRLGRIRDVVSVRYRRPE
jgi:hypothetical protein